MSISTSRGCSRPSKLNPGALSTAMIKFNLLSLSQMGRDHFIQHSVVLRVESRIK